MAKAKTAGRLALRYRCCWPKWQQVAVQKNRDASTDICPELRFNHRMTQSLRRPIPVRPRYPEPSPDFLLRAAFAHVVAAVRGSDDPAGCCRDLFPDDDVALGLITRAAVAPGTTGTAGWAAELVQTAPIAFLSGLAPLSAAAELIRRGISAPLDDGIGNLSAPHRAGAPTAAPWVGEGNPIPVRQITVAGATLWPKKMGVIVALSRQLARRSAAQAVFDEMLREDAAASLDAGYFSDTAESADAHAGLLNGVSPTGSPSGDMTTDLAELAEAVSVGGSGQVVFVTGPGRAATVPIRAPDLRVTVLPSLAVPEDRLIAIDPMSLVHGVGDVEVDAGEEMLLHMSDEPLPIVDGATADPVRSMYQTAGIALRMLVDLAFAKRRAGAVAYRDGVAWT